MDCVIFARFWEPGKVKTRLCPPLTPAEAARVNRLGLDVLVARLSKLDLRRVIAFEPERAMSEFAERYAGIDLELQRGEGLTPKLIHVVRSRESPCLITGSDCATVPLDRFRQAKIALERGADLVIGPAEDGGTYILGVTPGREDGFEAVPWSTGREQAELDRRARERGWSVALLESWYDVDRPADLCRFSVDVRAALSAGELERGAFEEEVRFVEELARRCR